MTSDSVKQHFDSVAPNYGRWKQKAHYYYDYVKAGVADVVPPGSRVLDVGCGTGDIIAFLQPREGLGIDLSPEMVAIAQTRHPHLNFAVHDLMGEPFRGAFDFVVAVDVAEHVPDLVRLMRSMAAALDKKGKVVLTTAHPSWRWILELAERLSLKMPEGKHEWRSREELNAAASAAGLRQVSYHRLFLVPKAVPGLKRLNRSRTLCRRFGLIQRMVLERAEPAS
jgi:SAM-dependent methyltransferase